ncbi:MAG: hypothetical protein ACXV5I_06715 [Halobacteriota archaeon]
MKQFTIVNLSGSVYELTNRASVLKAPPRAIQDRQSGYMGAEYRVRCLHCGHTFSVRQGGGFAFHLLHCDTCGEDVSIGFDELGEAHLRYTKGLPEPYCVASGCFDRKIQERYPGTPLSEEEYHNVVEQIAGGCSCGGSFTFDAPPRCPRCRSRELEHDGREGV